MKTAWSRAAAAVLVMMAMSACVSQGTYDALKQEYELTRGQLQQELEACRQEEEARGRELASCRDEVAAAKQANADMSAQNSALSDKLGEVMRDKAKLNASVDEMRRALQELNRSKAEADARMAEYRRLVARFKEMIDAGKLKVKIVKGRMVVELATDVLFASGSAALSREGKEALVEVAKILNTIQDREFQIEGHTDNVPMRGSTNWDLAANRALAVLRTMLEAGMSPQRISAASFGETKPTASNESSEGRQSNRRIEIVILPDLSKLPGFEELQKMSQ